MGLVDEHHVARLAHALAVEDRLDRRAVRQRLVGVDRLARLLAAEEPSNQLLETKAYRLYRRDKAREAFKCANSQSDGISGHKDKRVHFGELADVV